jgi:hypothetical protein
VGHIRKSCKRRITISGTDMYKNAYLSAEEKQLYIGINKKRHGLN